MRFHQALSFLDLDDMMTISLASQESGYSGVYLSDHIFNPRRLESRYTYSERDDGAPGWSPDTGWPDPMCVISAISTVTTSLTFTTGVYVAPLRDLMTVAKTVSTAAAISKNRVRLGVGVGWCKEEFDQTGQEFANRGRRLDEMIVALRELWSGGWVEFHGNFFDVPSCQMNPSPTVPIPILGGGHSEPALRRAAQHCDGWIAAGAYSKDEARLQLANLKEHLKRAGRALDNFSIYLSLAERPSLDLYHQFEEAGVTDIVCAPWIFAKVRSGATSDELLSARTDATLKFGEDYVQPLASSRDIATR